MRRTKFLQHTILGLGIAILCGAILWLVTALFVYEWNHTLFFLRPENQHLTEYNTPVYLKQLLYISAFQDPLSIIAFFIPFAILIIILGLLTYYGEYRY